MPSLPLHAPLPDIRGESEGLSPLTRGVCHTENLKFFTGLPSLLKKPYALSSDSPNFSCWVSICCFLESFQLTRDNEQWLYPYIQPRQRSIPLSCHWFGVKIHTSPHSRLTLWLGGPPAFSWDDYRRMTSTTSSKFASSRRGKWIGYTCTCLSSLRPFLDILVPSVVPGFSKKSPWKHRTPYEPGFWETPS